MKIGLFFPTSDFKVGIPSFLLPLVRVHNMALRKQQEMKLEEEKIYLKASPAEGYRAVYGLLTTAALLKEDGHKTKYFQEDYMKEQSTEAQFKKLADSDIVIIAQSVVHYPRVKKIAKNLKECNPNLIVATMGVIPTYLDIKTLKECDIDIAIRGEGEITTKEMCSVIENQPELKNLEKIKGLTFKINTTIKRTAARKPSSLDKIPPPAFEILPRKFKENANVMLTTSRGCGYKCFYCYENKFWGNVRYKSVQSVLNDIEKYLENFKFNHIFFFDSTFTMNKKRTINLLKELRKNFPDIYFSCNGRASTLDSTLINELKRSGCIGMFIGLQSSSVSVLKTVNRHEDPKLVYQIIKKLNTSLPFIDVSAIIGLPKESYQTASKTITFLRKLLSIGTFQVSTRVLVPYPGTPLFHHPEKFGIKILSYDFERYDRYSFPPVYRLDTLNELEIYSLFTYSYSTITQQLAKRVGLDFKFQQIDITDFKNIKNMNINKVSLPTTLEENE